MLERHEGKTALDYGGETEDLEYKETNTRKKDIAGGAEKPNM